MNIREIHYAFKIAKDRIDTLSNQDFNVAEIDWLINEAQMVFLKRRTGQNNSTRKGFEGDQKRIDDLSTLVIKYPLQPTLTPVLDEGIYEVDLSNLAYDYYRLISGKVNAILAEDCEKIVPLKFMQHDDYLSILRDPFNSPSQEFIPYNFGRSSSNTSTSIYIYPGDDISIDEVYLEYIKYPSRVSYGNYTYIDGVNYPEATLEFPEHTHQEIIDIAAEITSLNIDNPEYVSLKRLKSQINE